MGSSASPASLIVSRQDFGQDRGVAEVDLARRGQERDVLAAKAGPELARKKFG
jgi:hypothetical protein